MDSQSRLLWRRFGRREWSGVRFFAGEGERGGAEGGGLDFFIFIEARVSRFSWVGYTSRTFPVTISLHGGVSPTCVVIPVCLAIIAGWILVSCCLLLTAVYVGELLAGLAFPVQRWMTFAARVYFLVLLSS